MAGKNNGTGRPLFFRCWYCRRREARTPGHVGWYLQGTGTLSRVKLTGRTKPAGGNVGCRNDAVSREYVCQDCHHKGWSRHSDLRQIEKKR